jgi:hypothetical protein
MAIFRVEKNKENPYVMVNKNAAQDENISWKARGILLYLLSLPDDWKIYESELSKHSTIDGISSLRTGIKELIKAGYVERNLLHDKDGKFTGYEYVVREISTVIRKSENGKTENGKPHTTNNDLQNTDDTKYNNDNGVFPDGNNTLYSFHDKIIRKAISVYMNNLYKQKKGRKHPLLKPEQYKNVYFQISSFMDEWGIDYDALIDMMVQFLNSDIATDWNINHFATQGMMTNRMYEVAY